MPTPAPMARLRQGGVVVRDPSSPAARLPDAETAPRAPRGPHRAVAGECQFLRQGAAHHAAVPARPSCVRAALSSAHPEPSSRALATSSIHASTTELTFARSFRPRGSRLRPLDRSLRLSASRHLQRVAVTADNQIPFWVEQCRSVFGDAGAVGAYLGDGDVVVDRVR